ncbi:MAG: hypothetical protein R2765_05180 [Ferruginibacter sp.]
MCKSIEFLKEEGEINQPAYSLRHACTVGFRICKKSFPPNATIWCGDVDDEITAKGYIVPALVMRRPCIWF